MITIYDTFAVQSERAPPETDSTPELAEGMKILGVNIHTSSFDGTCFASDSAKICGGNGGADPLSLPP